MNCRSVIVFIIAIASPAVGSAADDPPIQGPPPPAPPAIVARDDQGRVTVRSRRVLTPLQFDGCLDEPFYRDVPAVGDFVQQEPREGQPATDRTEVWIVFDDSYLYVAARLWEEPGHRIAPDMRRDANTLYTNDHFGVSFDSFYDRRNGYGFAINPPGAMLDWSITNEQPNNSWNGIWDARTADFEGGWTIEIRFPFRSFRFREGGRIWGMQFRRAVRWRNEVSFLSPVLASWGRSALSKMSVAATVTDLEPPSSMRNLDVKPYALGSLLTDRNARPPFANEPNGDIGFDVKWGIRQTLVADLTVNTDFAQVEDDEQQVNLTRFSLQFPEKRDFFLEGADVFSFGGQSGPGGGGGGGGGGPQGGGQNTSTVPLVFYSRRIGLNNNVDVPIVVGGRLLGRNGPWRYGALNIQTAESVSARTPATNFTVGRVNLDILSRSRVGAIVTHRDPVGTTPVGEPGPGNLAYGADATINPTQEISILGYAARTHTDGRDDGVSYRGRFDWNSDRYGLQAEHLNVGDNFNPEVGFLRRASFRRSFGQARVSPRPGWRGIRKVFYEGSIDYITDTANRPESKELQGTYRMELENSDTWSVEVTRNYERLQNRFEVGRDLFVPAAEYEFSQVRGSYTLGQQRRLSGTITAARGGFYGGTLSELTWRGRVEVSQQMYLEPTLSWNRVDVPQGEADTNLVSTRATFSLTTRMFVSALVQYQSRSNSVTSNARFRWEYLPGSELFIVYSDGRTTISRGLPDVENRSFVVKATRLLRW